MTYLAFGPRVFRDACSESVTGLGPFTVYWVPSASVPLMMPLLWSTVAVLTCLPSTWFTQEL